METKEQRQERWANKAQRRKLRARALRLSNDKIRLNILMLERIADAKRTVHQRRLLRALREAEEVRAAQVVSSTAANKSRAAKNRRKKNSWKIVPIPEIRLDYDVFYRSEEWRRIRYDVLVRDRATCQCCGASPTSTPGVVMNVDHIKPISKFPELRLDIGNLQVLCSACNQGKGRRDQTDWRHEEPEEDTAEVIDLQALRHFRSI